MRPWLPVPDAAYDLLRQACEYGVEEALRIHDNIVDIPPTSSLGVAIHRYHRYGRKFLPQVKVELGRALQHDEIQSIIKRGGTARYRLDGIEELDRYLQVLNS